MRKPMVVLMLTISQLFGCGGPPDAAQVALTAGAIALVEADRIHDAALAAAAELAIQEWENMEAWEARMSRWVVSTRALETAADALRAMQHALDAWDAGSGDRGQFLDSAACLFPVLRLVVRQLGIHDLEVPEAIDNALRLLAPFVEGACPTRDVEIDDDDDDAAGLRFRDVAFFSIKPRGWGA